MTSLLNKNDYILIPKPGFPMYYTYCTRYNFNPLYYNLLPSKNWEIDLLHLESLILEHKDKHSNNRIKAIMVENPNNPCGSVLSETNLLGVLDIAHKYKLPIISDEIYEDFVDDKNRKFISLASLSDNVPLLQLSGISKSCLVPGWRLGWLIIYDPINAFNNVNNGTKYNCTISNTSNIKIYIK